MSIRDENSGKTESMAEKVYAIMRGERRPDDFEIPGYYEETHTIRRLTVSHFHELRDKGFTNKRIAQMYGLSELKVRKIINDPNLEKVYTVHIFEQQPLHTSRVKTAKKILDSSGHEVDRIDILNSYR